MIGQKFDYEGMTVTVLEDTYPDDVLVRMENGDSVTVPMDKLEA